jgi:hypothetical protein
MPMAGTDHLYVRSTDGVEWGAPKTIRQLIIQLETMDPDLPVHGALHVEIAGKRMARCRHLSMSFERVDKPWIKQGDESIPYSLVFWTQADEGARVDVGPPCAAAPAISAETRLREALEPFLTGWADENGWTDIACQNDRIVDWFGPSDFARVDAALKSQSASDTAPY